MAERKSVIAKKHPEEKPDKKSLENLNSFLYKLWGLVNDETLSVIRWSQDGEKIIIENPIKFTAKVLNNYERKIFKTKNISSFIRQLNLYGFRRVKETCSKTPIIFKHQSFKRGRVDLLVDVKRKKPVPTNKSLLTPPQKGHKSITVQGYNRSQGQSNPRYQFLSTAHNYPYLNSNQNLVRNNVHMPFIAPFAVNHGPTFINLGSHSTNFGKNGEKDQVQIAHNETAEEEKPQLPESQKQKTFYPWYRHGYRAAQEPGTTMNTAHAGNEVGYQVMMQNQMKYSNYPASSTNSVYSSLPIVTSYRNQYGDVESTCYPSSITSAKSIVPLPYHTPHVEHSYSNVTACTKSQRSVIKSENLPSSDSGFPERSGNDFGNDEARCDLYGSNSPEFTYITPNKEKECAEEKKA